jgi:hypothetical protein
MVGGWVCQKEGGRGGREEEKEKLIRREREKHGGEGSWVSFA